MHQIFNGTVINRPLPKLKAGFLEIAEITNTCAAISFANSIIENCKRGNLSYAAVLFERLKEIFGTSEHFQKALQIIDGCSLISTQGYHMPLTTQFDDETELLSYRGALFSSEQKGTPGYWLLSELSTVQKKFGDFVECIYTGQGFTEEKITGNMRHIISLTEILRELECKERKLRNKIMYSRENEYFHTELSAILPQIKILKKEIHKFSNPQSTKSSEMCSRLQHMGFRAIPLKLIKNSRPIKSYTILPGWVGVCEIKTQNDIDSIVAWIQSRYAALWWKAAMFAAVPCCQNLEEDFPDFIQFQNIPAKEWMYVSLIREWVKQCAPSFKDISDTCSRYEIQQSHMDTILKYSQLLQRNV